MTDIYGLCVVTLMTLLNCPYHSLRLTIRAAKFTKFYNFKLDNITFLQLYLLHKDTKTKKINEISIC